MTLRIVLLSGPLAVGKSAVADVLRAAGFKKISSSGYLSRIAKGRQLPETREALQQLGDSLDGLTSYAWIVDDVAVREISDDPRQEDWFVDAVRKEDQVRHFRSRFSDVLHAHFTAPDDILRSRFLSRAREGDGVHDDCAYDRYVAHPNEQSARALGQVADLTIDLGAKGPQEAAEEILGYRRGR